MPRRPKPVVKELEGRASKRQLDRVPRPRPPKESATRPWGTLTADERRHHDRALRELLLIGHLAEVDIATLTMRAKAHATALNAHADVRRRGAIVAGARGGRERVKNPSVAIARDFSSLARSLATELGMTPSGRVGLRTDGARIPSSLAALLGDEEESAGWALVVLLRPGNTPPSDADPPVHPGSASPRIGRL
jgi:P27 family predicted phage terminase small subunit